MLRKYYTQNFIDQLKSEAINSCSKLEFDLKKL